MEEILASIRRIISDDQSLPKQARAEVETLPREETSASVHVLKTIEDAAPVEAMTHDADESAMAAQGLIAAPQFARPEGPVFEPDANPRLVAEPENADALAFEAVHEPLEAASAGREEAQVVRAEPPRDMPRTESHDRSGEPAATLLSTTTNNTVSSAFNLLAASRLADNSAELLDMAREMVRPLLRNWLDDNLPALVERLVRDEIERVARGGR